MYNVKNWKKLKISGAHKHWRGSKKIEQKKKLKKRMPEKVTVDVSCKNSQLFLKKSGALKKERRPKNESFVASGW